MSKKIQLRLISSEKMSEAGEDDVIRFPRRARECFGFSTEKVSVGKGRYEITLQAKPAYKSDVRRLAIMIGAHTLSEEEARRVGFVTSRVQNRIIRKEESGDAWVTGGISNITVGADPEFGLIGNDGLLVLGSQIVPHEGRFGSDGPSVEVRPNPSTNHIDVVNNIREILHNPPHQVEPYLWRGGATYTDSNRVFWFGGHIHLGRPSQIPAENAYPIYERIATALDGLLALPMSRFDTPEPWQRRAGCKFKYGMAGDIRADYPEQNRFEYRVLSGLWLVHPTLAKIAIGTAKCVAETAYSRIAEKGFDVEWASAPISRNSMLKSFGIKGLTEIRAVINRARPDQIASEMIELWARWVQDLDRYEDYKPEIKALIALANEDPNSVEKGIDLDVRKNWQGGENLLPRASKKLRIALDEVEAQ